MKFRIFAALIVWFVSLCGAASAEDKFVTFSSTLWDDDPGWCIDVPDFGYNAGARLQLWDCVEQTNQSFGVTDKGPLTIGGLCVDGLGQGPGPVSEGAPVGLALCDGSPRQNWNIVSQPTPKNFALVNGKLCLTVENPAGGRRALFVLRTCNQPLQQSFTMDETDRPQYVNGKLGSFVADDDDDDDEDDTAKKKNNDKNKNNNTWQGHRYCWYDSGWNGRGWYWCGENRHPGVGWGGPNGWHSWFHRGPGGGKKRLNRGPRGPHLGHGFHGHSFGGGHHGGHGRRH